MTAESVREIVDVLEAAAIEVWLDGGWGVDALLGESVRSHSDLDLILRASDSQRVRDTLGERGFKEKPGGTATNFVLADSLGREVDVHCIAFDARGYGVFRLPDGGKWPFPPSAFQGRGRVAGREVRCLSAEAQVQCHGQGYAPQEKDLSDMERLQARFGVVLPLALSRQESLEQRVARMVREEVAIAPYDPAWPESFRREAEHLRACLPSDLLRRIEHFGSTAVPGLAAKPIVDLLVEVTDLEAARARIAPVLEAQGYDYFWRPTFGDDVPPFYAWFVRRDPVTGARTHHIHMIEATPAFAEHWDRLYFRDYLREHPEAAREYEALKRGLSADSPGDRVTYTAGKTAFVRRVTAQAKRHYGAS
jgi:GrpB-like predicted nucleotidyltransferase (UPF0157 family)